uniref:Cytohesin 4 n=1 Tax=Ovis aries TaxID=9940 RepID=A0AC11D7Q5_SHEEP
MDLCHPDPGELSSGEAEELQRIKWHRKQLLEDIQPHGPEGERAVHRPQEIQHGPHEGHPVSH